MMTKRIGLRLLFLALVFSSLAGCTAIAPTPSRLKPSFVRNEIVFDASFDSGSLASARSFSDHRFLVRPRPDYGRDGGGWAHQWGASWNGRTWWYYFSITVPEERLPYSIELKVDAFRAWSRRMYAADKVPVVSCDGTNWRFVHDWKAGIGSSVISDTLTCPTTYVAMATPYPWARMKSFLQSLATSPYIIKQEIIGHTPLGKNQETLPLYYLLLSEPGAQNGDKRNVVVTSGQHPGETTNSWTLTGLMEFLLSNDALARSLRQEFAFHIYPAVNPEGVKYGFYRRTADSPLNTNRAWNTNEVLEVEIVRNHILSQTHGRADYLFDLHGTAHSKHYIWHYSNHLGVREWIDAVAARHPHVSTNHGQHWWSRYLEDRSAIRWGLNHLRSHGNPKEPALSVTVEGSYSQGSWEGKPDQTADWKALGAALVKSICDVEGLVRQ